jgi:hypothetical protein
MEARDNTGSVLEGHMEACAAVVSGGSSPDHNLYLADLILGLVFQMWM